MHDLIFYTVVFIFIIILRFVLYMVSTSKKRKDLKKKHRLALNFDIQYLVTKFKLDEKKMMSKKIMILVSLVDSFVLTLSVFFAFSVTDVFILIMLIGVVLILLLVYVLYEIIGNILIKKGYGKNE